MKLHITALVSISLWLFSGCAWFGGEQKEKAAYDLVQDGIQAYEDGNYSGAIKSFEQLKDWYPFSKYAILAELKIADAHYQSEQYAEAVLAYEEFEQLHPRNEAVPYVIYQTGRCYYDQIDTIDRDQTPAQKSLEIFRRLIRQFPDDDYSNHAQIHIAKCLQSLAGHELYVAEFYYRTKRYKAALQRFKAVITNYPDVGLHHQALKYIARCEALAERSAENQN